jgi:putative hydrolase of the HAD superfamily
MPEARREVARRAYLSAGFGNFALAASLGGAFAAHRDRSMRLFDGTIEVLEALRAAGVLMALVTNGSSDFQRAKIDRFDLERHFNYVLIEEEFGAGKPEDIVYCHLLNHFAINPEDAWMIGDNLDWEVVAPQRHGIRGIWFNGYGKKLPSGTLVRPDATITTLGKLLEPGFKADG